VFEEDDDDVVMEVNVVVAIAEALVVVNISRPLENEVDFVMVLDIVVE
jgi:hypothetical protein